MKFGTKSNVNEARKYLNEAAGAKVEQRVNQRSNISLKPRQNPFSKGKGVPGSFTCKTKGHKHSVEHMVNFYVRLSIVSGTDQLF